jgi:hypothetical protein
MRDWNPIHTAPFERNVHLSVIEGGEVHMLVFPCRQTEVGWVHGGTGLMVPVGPTHWREWQEAAERTLSPARD